MRVREATSNDLDALVRIGTRALVNSKIEGYLCPERTKFPEAYRTWYRGRVAAALLAPYTLLLVAEREPADGGVGGEEDVVAYAAWHFKQAVSAKHAVMPSGLPPGVQLAKDSLEYREYLALSESNFWLVSRSARGTGQASTVDSKTAEI